MRRKIRPFKDEETQPPLTQRPGFIIGMTFLGVVAAVIISVLIFRFIQHRKKAALETASMGLEIEAAASTRTEDDFAGQLPEPEGAANGEAELTLAKFERFSLSRRKANRKAARKSAKAEDLSRRKPAAAAKQRALQRAAEAPSVLGKRDVEQTKPLKQNHLKKKRKVKGAAFFNKEEQRALQQAAAEQRALQQAAAKDAAEYAEQKRIVEQAILQQAAAEQKELQRAAAEQRALQQEAAAEQEALQRALQQAAAKQKTSRPILHTDSRGKVRMYKYNTSTNTWEG